MLSSQRLHDAGELVEWLRLALHERSLPATDRTRASGGCFGIAREHHHAVVLLMHYGRYASCFLLLRVEFEAYIRGLWLAHCAPDRQVSRFLEGAQPPRVEALLEAIERKPGFTEKVLSGIKSKSWKAMCTYTHTGGLHVQRWNTSDVIEANYEVAEVEEVLLFAELIAAMSVVGIAQLAENDELAMKVVDKMRGLGAE